MYYLVVVTTTIHSVWPQYSFFVVLSALKPAKTTVVCIRDSRYRYHVAASNSILHSILDKIDKTYFVVVVV